MEELNACKAAFDEARLERALLRMAGATSKPRSLQSFSWRFGEGTASNATTCEYMLRACEKVSPSSLTIISLFRACRDQLLIGCTNAPQHS